MTLKRWISSAAIVVIALFSTVAHAQRVKLSVESRAIYAGLPFVLSVVAEGFDEAPEPTISDFQIPGCRVVFIGVSPNVSSSITIINGRRTQTRQVSYVFQYKIEAATGGTYEVPVIEVTQGGKKAASEASRFNAKDIDTTTDMKIKVSVPERALWIGETFELVIDWYLRKDPSSPSFSIPLFDREDLARVAAPPVTKGLRTLEFSVGARTLELPYERDNEVVGGVQYNRFRFRANVTPKKSGTFELDPAKVVASLEVGTGRDSFGFPVRRNGVFKAEDRARSLEIKPVPATGKPPSFNNAVGTGFSIEAQASRTVVRVGEPIELTITIRGDSHLEGLSLPSMSGEHALSPKQFEIADVAPSGELSEDGKAKTFKVTARLVATDAREIPALPFSYFSPKTAQYSTVRSRPIALQVAGSAVVGAGDVVSGTQAVPAESTAARNEVATSLVNADLSLSDPRDTLGTVMSPSSVRPFAVILCGLSVLLFGFRTWQRRTSEQRGRSSEVRKALNTVLKAVDRGKKSPARDAAPEIASALRALASILGRRATAPVLDRLDTEGYSPDAKSDPLSAELLADARHLAQGWVKKSSATGAAKTAATLLLVVAGASAAPAVAAAADGPTLEEARTTYAAALEEGDRAKRAQGFAQAQRLFSSLVGAHPDRPELLTDWGNAALGARDFGTATLAYRRALALNRGQARAEKNLAWLRSRAGSDLPTAKDSGAVDSLFFWHRQIGRAQKVLTAAACFALAMLLITPLGLSEGRQRVLRRLSLVPWAGVIALGLSLGFEHDPSRDVVVMTDGVVLRSADSAGAPAARATPIPAGAEAELVERRDGWVRVRFANGSSGWLPTGSTQPVIDER